MSEPTDGDRSIGANLRRARERIVGSRRRLSDKSGVSEATIARIELYGALPNLSTLRALADALDMSVAELDAPAGENVGAA